MKILLVTQTYRDSYPPRNLSMASAVKQAEQLSKLYQVTVLTCGRRIPLEKVSPSLTVISVTGRLFPDPINYVVSFPLLSRFIKLVREIKPDYVMVSKFMFFSSFVIPIAKAMGMKVITTTDTFPGINWFPRSKLITIIMWIYARVIGLPLLWMSDKVILLYSELKPIADKYHLKSVVIPNGVEESLLNKQSLPKNLIKPKNETWIGFVGRAESVKGYDIAIKTADLLKSYKRIKFIFIGGNQNQSSSGNKIFLGFRHDLYNIYQLLDVLLVPSISEGLPNVVMEAMAQGVPVIANPVGGLQYLVIDRQTGLQVSQNTSGDFAQTLLRLRSDRRLRRQMSAQARRRIATDYSWPRILPAYKSLFTSLSPSL